MQDTNDRPTVIPFPRPCPKAPTPFEQLAKDYAVTTVTSIVIRYGFTARLVALKSILFVFDLGRDLRAPSPELWGRTIDLFANYLDQLPRDSHDGRGTLEWDLARNTLDREHCIMTALVPPLP